jgi:hypothetical protein
VPNGTATGFDSSSFRVAVFLNCVMLMGVPVLEINVRLLHETFHESRHFAGELAPPRCGGRIGQGLVFMDEAAMIAL